MNDRDVTGLVFSTQRFSIHDGGGIRTLVFLKGCPLRCRWCSNPESQKAVPEHAFNPNRCLGAGQCGRCLAVCPSGALTKDAEGRIRYDATLCTSCGACAAACPTGAQTLYGERRSVADILRKVEEDDVFYQRSGGGLTLSGGEAMAQPRFVLALLREARKARIHTMMETCGHYRTDRFHEACALLDGLIFDVKTLDSAKHKEFTGRGNERILANLNHAFTHFPDLPVTLRTPVIPGFNDDPEMIRAIRASLPRRPNVRYEVLTYHRLGMPKYGYLGRPWLMGDVTADEALMAALRSELAREAGDAAEAGTEAAEAAQGA
ncbi:MAG: glycyl-radical enzyme activating protein [Desulfovibrio sp.]|nr:glycyl-radical enzyme activating protein [Desulfovibrio sp.]